MATTTHPVAREVKGQDPINRDNFSEDLETFLPLVYTSGTSIQSDDTKVTSLIFLTDEDGGVRVFAYDMDGAGSHDGSTVLEDINGVNYPLASITLAGLVTGTADINGGTIDGATIGGSSAGAITCTTLTVNTSQGATTFSGNINMNANDVILRDGDTYFSNSVDNLIRYVVTATIVFDIWSTFVESWKPFLCKSYIKTESTTVASLTAAATAGAGARSFVTDANATTFASVVAGGGSNAVPVYSDGTNWRIG